MAQDTATYFLNSICSIHYISLISLHESTVQLKHFVSVASTGGV